MESILPALQRVIKKRITSLRTNVHTRVIRNFFIYSGGTVIVKSISLILMPFVLSVLTPSEYGLLSLIMSFATMFTIFSGLGLRQTFGIEYFHCNSRERRSMANDIILLYLVIAGPAFILCALFPNLLNRYIFMHAASTHLILIALAYCFAQFFVELFYQVLRYQCRALTLTLVQITVALSTIGLNLLFLYIFQLSVTGMLLGYLIGSCIAVIAGGYSYLKAHCLPHIRIKKSIKTCHYYLRLSLPFIPGMLFNWVLAAGDKWILARMGTLTDVGIYSLADTFGQAYQMLILYPMAGSYLPYLFKRFAHYKNNPEQLRYVEYKNRQLMIRSMIIMALLIVLGSIIGTPILQALLPKKYHAAISYTWYIFFGYLFLMGTYFASAIIQFYKKTLFLAFSLCVPAILNIILNTILIPHWGIYGCICATICAYMVYFTTIVWYNKKILGLVKP